MATTSCPHCGEPIDTYPDPGGGSPQEYIEDCSVCCRPIVCRYRAEDGALTELDIEAESR